MSNNNDPLKEWYLKLNDKKRDNITISLAIIFVISIILFPLIFLFIELGLLSANVFVTLILLDISCLTVSLFFLILIYDLKKKYKKINDNMEKTETTKNNVDRMSKAREAKMLKKKTIKQEMEYRKNNIYNHIVSIILKMYELSKNDKVMSYIKKFSMKQGYIYDLEFFAIPRYYGQPINDFFAQNNLEFDSNKLESTLDDDFDSNEYLREFCRVFYYVNNENNNIFKQLCLDLKEKDEFIFSYFITGEGTKYYTQDTIENCKILPGKNYVKNLRAVRYLFEALVSEGMIENLNTTRDALYLLIANVNYLNNITDYENTCLTYGIDTKFNEKACVVNKLINQGVDTKIIVMILINRVLIERPFTRYVTQYFYELEYVEKIKSDLKKRKFLESLDNPETKEKITLADIDVMSGVEFENFVADLFEKMGYKTFVTKASNDQGIDIVATKNDVRFAIQAKCYSGVVGNHAVMEAVAGMKFYNADKCMVVTNNNFTKSARELAQKNNVELWDRKVLQEKINEVM